MRTYEITRKGKDKVKTSGQNRNAVLDFMYGPPTKTVTLDEIKSLTGDKFYDVLRDLKIKQYVREVPDGSF